MITRIVKLTFDADKIEAFKSLFESTYEKIRSMPGCLHLELWQDIHNPCIFFTHSKWDSEECLNKYRDSMLFAEVWTETKKFFAGKPEAWSVKDY